MKRTTGRRNHRWDPVTPLDETMHGRALLDAFEDGMKCRHCGLVERAGTYRRFGRGWHVLQWWTPDGRLLGVRPTEVVEAPKDAPELAVAFPGVAVIRSPQCPKTPAAWGTPNEPARIRVEV